MKNLDFLMVFRGHIVSDITGDTFSDQEMLFGTFLMKNIFIGFSTLILNHVFCSISFKISCFLMQNLMVLCEYNMIVQTKPMKIIGFFDEIEQKS